MLVGAQAIYFHTGDADVPIASSTTDADLALIPDQLGDTPLVEDAMRDAGFSLDLQAGGQPGAWLSPDGIPVELLVPRALDRGATRRSADLSPHARESARKVVGLEAAALDHTMETLSAIDSDDPRSAELRIAGPAALMVAKLHKIGERAAARDRLLNKDSHDLYRLLLHAPATSLAPRLSWLHDTALAGDVTKRALEYLRELSGSEDAPIPQMAAEAESAIGGDPAVLAARVWALAQDLLDALDLARDAR